jgi:excisionase family DNA binding protein
LRPREAAEALGVSLRTLERLTRTGEIDSVLIGRCRVYELETLKAYLLSRRESAKGGRS